MHLMSSQVDVGAWVSGLVAFHSRSGLAWPASGERSSPIPAVVALALAEPRAAPACCRSARLGLVSHSDFSVPPCYLSFFLSLLLFSGLLHISPLVYQDVPPQASVNSWPLAKFPHCWQLAPSGHCTVLQTKTTRESLRPLGF